MAVRRILAAVLTAPLLTLTACGGGSGSIADPPISSAPSSSTPTQQRETPEHFIRRWAAEEKRMENTGMTDAYVALSRPCKACMSLVRDVKKFYAAGGFIKWGGLRVLNVKKISNTGSQSIVLHVKTDSQPTRYRQSASAQLQTIDGGVSSQLVTLTAAGLSWRVTSRARVSS